MLNDVARQNYEEPDALIAHVWICERREKENVPLLPDNEQED